MQKWGWRKKIKEKDEEIKICCRLRELSSRFAVRGGHVGVVPWCVWKRVKRTSKGGGRKRTEGNRADTTWTSEIL